MSNKVRISTDSTVDLNKELVEKYGITVHSMPITMGDKTYFDGIDITPNDLFEYTNTTGQLAKTSTLNTDFYLQQFGTLTADGSEVVHFSISSSMSGAFNCARIAALEMENVYVVDSANLSTGIALLVLKAAELALQGMSAKEIVEKIEDLKDKVDASFVIDTLTFLHKGGRCSAVAMLGANVLKLKPCIEVKDGAMGVGKKYRGKISDVFKEYAAAKLENIDDIDTSRVFVTSTCGDDPIVEEIADYVRSLNAFDEVLVTTAGCTIAAHCGPGTLGVLFIRKSAKQ